MPSQTEHHRYVVVQVKAVSGCVGIWWSERALTAAEGFHLLESRIAEELLDRGARPQIALVDCHEGRILGASHSTSGDPWLIESARARSVIQCADAHAPAVAPREASEEDALDPSDELPDDLQELTDLVVAGFLDGTLDDWALDELCQRIAAGDEVYGFDGQCVPGVLRSDVQRWLRDREEDEVRTQLGLNEEFPLTAEHWIRFLDEYGLESLLEDGDFSYSMGPHAIEDSRGRTIVLVKRFQGYSFSGVEISWGGAWHSWAEFEAELARLWFTEDDGFGQLAPVQKEVFVRGARPELGPC